jgi:hypothetical protein
VARATDPVADGLASDQVRRLEGAELLEHAGPTGTEQRRKVIR